MQIDKDEIKNKARDLGFDLVGICKADSPKHLDFYKDWLDSKHHGTMLYMENSVILRSDPKYLLSNAESIVAVGLNYYQDQKKVPGHPYFSRLYLGRDYHKVLKGKLKTLARALREIYPEESFRPCVDSAPIFEREYAHLAGLGWFGKNTNLINTYRGSFFAIGLLLTSLKIEPDEPAVGHCGSCRLCIEKCPTGAIVYQHGRWQVDSRRCISYLTIEYKGEIEPELAEKVGGYTFGCDICQEVCPFNFSRPHQPLRASQATELDFLNHREWPSLRRILEISPLAWDHLTQGSAVRRAGYEGIKRNARINLQNSKKQELDPA